MARIRFTDLGFDTRVGRTSVRVNGSFLVAYGVMGISLGTAMRAIAFLVVAVVSVLVHELGHAVAFRRCGGVESSITFSCIGAETRARAMPTRRAARIAIYVAGPLAMVGILGVPALLVTTAFPEAPPSWEMWLTYLVWLNLYFAAYNLLPVRPLDGGEVLAELVEAMTSRTWAIQLSAALSAAAGLAGAWVLFSTGFHDMRRVFAAAPDPTIVGNPWLILMLLGAWLAVLALLSVSDVNQPDSRRALRLVDEAVRALREDDLESADALAREAITSRAAPLALELGIEVLAWIALARDDQPRARRTFAEVSPCLRERSHLRCALEAHPPDRVIAMSVRSFRHPLALAPPPSHIRALADAGVLDQIGEALLTRGADRAARGRRQFMDALFRAGRYEDAITFGERLLSLDPDPGTVATNIACSCAQAGDVDVGLSWIDRSYGEFGCRDLEILRTDEDLDPLREDPRFTALQARIEARLSKHRSTGSG